MIRSRLYLKIYLTVIGSLALVVLSLTTMAIMGRLDTKSPIEDRVERFASVMLAGRLTFDERQEMLERLSRALDADIAIFDREGQFRQGAGILVPSLKPPTWRLQQKLRTFVVTLPDGSHFVAAVRKPVDPPRGNLILSILVIALVIGVAAYPVVRNLTRRLDLLRQSMDKWGSGSLSARAPVTGKDEIAIVAGTFNRAADRIEALVESQKSLLANASHELRSPLARLRMATEMYELNQNENSKKEIVRNLAELDELVEEILLKSRLGSDQPVLLDQLVDLLEIAAEEAAAVDAEIEGGSLLVKGNEKLIRRLIRNLLQNAARHGRPPILISLSENGSLAVITVRDHGDGLKPEEMSRIFEPFFRPEGRSEAAGGWGLGLALVAEIARLHGGRAYAARAEDDGACFVVEIAREPSGGSDKTVAR